MYSCYLLATFKMLCGLVMIFSNVVSEPLRPRRQLPQQKYIVDTMVVVDDQMYSWFKQWMMTTSNVPLVDTEAKLKEYVSLVIHQVNARYSNINSLQYVINFQLVSLITNQNILGSLYTGSNSLDSGTALDVFKTWLKQTTRGTYDHAILLTGYKLSGPSVGSETKGRAYVGKLCDRDGFSASIVQEDGAFQSAHYISHELAHNLGSEHDGEGQSGLKCSPADRYIMAPVRDTIDNAMNKLNPWLFSNCSVTSIDITINSITTSSLSDCLSSTLTPMSEFTATVNVVPGQLYPVDVQCRMLHGSTSRACLGLGFGNLSEICTEMYCLEGSPSEQTTYRCAQHFAAEGTTCGNKKWCRLGMCVEAADAPAAPEDCPNGDSILNIKGLSCAAFIKNNSWACYNDTWRKIYCCASCRSVRLRSEECAYGDKSSGCSKQYCGLITTSGKDYSKECCATCGAGTTNTCTDVSSIDGVSCAARVIMNERQDCYNTSVAGSCCRTCSQLHTNITGCEYGDRMKGSYCDILSNKNQECETKQHNCCSTCKQYSRAASRDWSTVMLLFVILCGRVINIVQS